MTKKISTTPKAVLFICLLLLSLVNIANYYVNSRINRLQTISASEKAADASAPTPITDAAKEIGTTSANPILEENKYDLTQNDILLGQNFIVGIYGVTLDERTKNFLKLVKPGGIILYERNYESESQFKKLISDLQKLSLAETRLPFFIMMDEEPGGATRLNLFRNELGFIKPSWEKIESDIRKMAAIGANVNLAPIADYPFNKNAFIKTRISTNSPDELKEFNKNFIGLLQKNQVSATLKHFPGIGVFTDDPHEKPINAVVDEKIFNDSVGIFKSGIDAGARFIMTSHASYGNIDKNVPATLSEKIITGLLRNTLGFKGLIITDDLAGMPFINDPEMDLAQATAQSLAAGHNLVIFSHNNPLAAGVYGKLLSNMDSDSGLKIIVEKNYRDVALFKQQYLSPAD